MYLMIDGDGQPSTSKLLPEGDDLQGFDDNMMLFRFENGVFEIAEVSVEQDAEENDVYKISDWNPV